MASKILLINYNLRIDNKISNLNNLSVPTKA